MDLSQTSNNSFSLSSLQPRSLQLCLCLRLRLFPLCVRNKNFLLSAEAIELSSHSKRNAFFFYFFFINIWKQINNTNICRFQAKPSDRYEHDGHVSSLAAFN